jgi:hypothetical protein
MVGRRGTPPNPRPDGLRLLRQSGSRHLLAVVQVLRDNWFWVVGYCGAVVDSSSGDKVWESVPMITLSATYCAPQHSRRKQLVINETTLQEAIVYKRVKQKVPATCQVAGTCVT